MYFYVYANPADIDFSRSEYILLESMMNNTVPVTVTGGTLPIDTVIEVNPDESSSNAGDCCYCFVCL